VLRFETKPRDEFRGVKCLSYLKSTDFEKHTISTLCALNVRQFFFPGRRVQSPNSSTGKEQFYTRDPSLDNERFRVIMEEYVSRNAFRFKIRAPSSGHRFRLLHSCTRYYRCERARANVIVFDSRFREKCIQIMFGGARESFTAKSYRENHRFTR